jgi:sugar lactone lactonase YvrE
MQGSFGDEAYIDPQWVPTERPVFESLHVDDQGRLWVAIPTPEGRQSFEVLDLDGRLVARAELPRDISLASRPLVRGSFMYLVTRDDLDITYVVRLHIEETPAT